MPLDDFLSEAVDLLAARPDAHEIQVGRVKFPRRGEARGDCDTAVAARNERAPYGR